MSMLSEWISSWFTKSRKRSSSKLNVLNDKTKMLDELSVSHAKLAYCQEVAEESNRPEEAKKLETLKKEMKLTIDLLTAEAFENWIGEVTIIKDELSGAHSELHKIIGAIEQQQAIFENIVKAIGKVEEIIEKAKTLVPTLDL